MRRADCRDGRGYCGRKRGGVGCHPGRDLGGHRRECRGGRRVGGGRTPLHAHCSRGGTRGRDCDGRRVRVWSRGLRYRNGERTEHREARHRAWRSGNRTEYRRRHEFTGSRHRQHAYDPPLCLHRLPPQPRTRHIARVDNGNRGSEVASLQRNSGGNFRQTCKTPSDTPTKIRSTELGSTAR